MGAEWWEEGCTISKQERDEPTGQGVQIDMRFGWEALSFQVQQHLQTLNAHEAEWIHGD